MLPARDDPDSAESDLHYLRLLVDFSYGGGRARLLSRCSAGRSHYQRLPTLLGVALIWHAVPPGAVVRRGSRGDCPAHNSRHAEAPHAYCTRAGTRDRAVRTPRVRTALSCVSDCGEQPGPRRLEDWAYLMNPTASRAFNGPTAPVE